MNLEPLSDINFLLYAAKHYDNPQCFDTIEFYEDINRIKYLKKLFNRYKETGDLKDRLIINHLVVIYNVFGVDAATRMLFLKLGEYHDCLKPFLSALGYMPEKVSCIGINGRDVYSVEIVSDPKITRLLKDI